MTPIVVDINIITQIIGVFDQSSFAEFGSTKRAAAAAGPYDNVQQHIAQQLSVNNARERYHLR
jgi:ribonuclease PH